MSDLAVIIIVAVIVVALAVVAFFVIRRRRYVLDLRRRGWTFDSKPNLDWVLDHHAPPFGLGFERDVDEGVSGTTAAGVPFRVFEYTSKEGGPRFDQRLASLQLPIALPDLFVSGAEPRFGVRVPPVDLDPYLQVRAGDPGYARAVLSSAVIGAIATFGQAGHRVDLSIDGFQLVSVGAPKDPDDLQAYLDLLSPIARAIDPAALAAYAVHPPPRGFGFYGRPDWLLLGRDDSLIAKYGLTTVGFGHTTEKVIRGYNDGLPLEAFVHRWKTQRTEHYTDSDGKSKTRTVTENHSEILMAISMPFSLPLLSVGGGWGGKKVRFESEEFNDAFKVRTSSAKFASDVIHPRQMEYLMAIRPPGFTIDGQWIRFFPGQHDTLLIGLCADVAHGFLARVPAFVWKDLQVAPPAFRA